MQTKVVSIEKIMPVSVMPDGEYKGVWGGYEVVVKIAGLEYRLKTENGIRTPSTPCVVRVKSGFVTVSLEGPGNPTKQAAPTSHGSF